MTRQIKEQINNLINECKQEEIPIFISIGTETNRKNFTVTPEEVGENTDKIYNNFLRILTGFDKRDYL